MTHARICPMCKGEKEIDLGKGIWDDCILCEGTGKTPWLKGSDGP